MKSGSEFTPEEKACLNTDREIYREPPGDYYADSVHVTEGGALGINCGGMVHVRPLREWHRLAEPAMSEKVESDPLGEEPTHFELARTRTLRKRIADIVATHDAFVADATNPARAYELRDAVDRARAIGLTRAEMAQYQDYDCPHAAPHRYCETCKVDPCPLSFKHKDHRSNERGER